MVFGRLWQRLFGGWPADLPRFYPDLDDRQLAEFLSDAEYRRIKSLENVYVLPLASETAEGDQLAFGVGLAKVLQRNLMLLRDVSIHGPEDTADVLCEQVQELLTEKARSGFVTGRAHFGPSGYSLHWEVLRPNRRPARGEVRHSDLGTFVRDACSAVGRALGSRLQTTVADAWEVGQPRDVRVLVRLGALRVRFGRDNTPAKVDAARTLLAADSGFSLPVWEIDDEVPGARRVYLEALRRDPYNAQICFQIFCAVWKARGPDPAAFQFCRKAVELSPGHGKAHMCTPHSAPGERVLLRHSELGYRLLPGNSFAVNNYILNLRRTGAPSETLMNLAEEGIAADPHDPGLYYQMIELLSAAQEYGAALEIAERLQRLFEPKMDERALYCLNQNPERARMIASGEYNPAADNRQTIARLRRLARDG